MFVIWLEKPSLGQIEKWRRKNTPSAQCPKAENSELTTFSSPYCHPEPWANLFWKANIDEHVPARRAKLSPLSIPSPGGPTTCCKGKFTSDLSQRLQEGPNELLNPFIIATILGKQRFSKRMRIACNYGYRNGLCTVGVVLVYPHGFSNKKVKEGAQHVGPNG